MDKMGTTKRESSAAAVAWESEPPSRHSGIRLRTIASNPESTPPPSEPSDPSTLVFQSLLWGSNKCPLTR